VALQANRSEWSGITLWLVVLLAVVTIVVATAGALLRLAAIRVHHEAEGASPGPDWFSDVVTLAEGIAAWLGPLARLAGASVRWLNRCVVASIRRYPITAAAGAALAFGVLLALNTMLREGAGPALWIDVVVGSTGMFAFLVAAGAYVGLVRSGRPAPGDRCGRDRMRCRAGGARVSGLAVVGRRQRWRQPGAIGRVAACCRPGGCLRGVRRRDAAARASIQAGVTTGRNPAGRGCLVRVDS
jgi:hypothetical protein